MGTNPAFHRMELLSGTEALRALAETPIIIFGIGGVGSWCAEALVRSGAQNLTLVDSDLVCVTNINRQVQATIDTVGKPKTDMLRDRLLSINPRASVTAIQKAFDNVTESSFDLGAYRYVVDAIDSLSNKVELIIKAYNSGAAVYSALGASCKLDPSRIRIASLWESHGCRLGHFVRKRLRRRGFDGEVTCVYSDERVPLHEIDTPCGTGNCMCPKKSADGSESHEWCGSKKQINGSAVHITGIFGFMLAGLINQDIIKTCVPSQMSAALS